MFRLRWRVQVHEVAGARLHERDGERRAPADVAAVEVHLVGADDRDDLLNAGGGLVGDGCAEEYARTGRSRPRRGGVDDHGGVNAFREKAKPRIDLAQPSFAVMIVGVFTAVPVTGSPRYHLNHGGPLASQQEAMLVSQPLQSGGRDVIFERRSRLVSHRPSERSLGSHLPICHGISCICG